MLNIIPLLFATFIQQNGSLHNVLLATVTT